MCITPATLWNDPDSRSNRELIILMRTSREGGWLLWFESYSSRRLHKSSGLMNWLIKASRSSRTHWMHCVSVSSSISKQGRNTCSRLLCTWLVLVLLVRPGHTNWLAKSILLHCLRTVVPVAFCWLIYGIAVNHLEELLWIEELG